MVFPVLISSLGGGGCAARIDPVLERPAAVEGDRQTELRVLVIGIDVEVRFRGVAGIANPAIGSPTVTRCPSFTAALPASDGELHAEVAAVQHHVIALRVLWIGVEWNEDRKVRPLLGRNAVAWTHDGGVPEFIVFEPLRQQTCRGEPRWVQRRDIKGIWR